MITYGKRKAAPLPATASAGVSAASDGIFSPAALKAAEASPSTMQTAAATGTKDPDWLNEEGTSSDCSPASLKPISSSHEPPPAKRARLATSSGVPAGDENEAPTAAAVTVPSLSLPSMFSRDKSRLGTEGLKGGFGQLFGSRAFTVLPQAKEKASMTAAKKQLSSSSSSSSSSSFSSSSAAPALTQTFLDFGQKGSEGSTVCKLCGMVYAPGLESDEKAHRKHCADTSRSSSAGNSVAGATSNNSHVNAATSSAPITASDKLLRPFFVREVKAAGEGGSAAVAPSSFLVYCVPATSDPLSASAASSSSLSSVAPLGSGSPALSKLRAVAELLVAELGPSSHPFFAAATTDTDTRASSSPNVTSGGASEGKGVKYWLAFLTSSAPTAAVKLGGGESASSSSAAGHHHQHQQLTLVGCLVTESIKQAHRYHTIAANASASSSSSSSSFSSGIELDRSKSNTFEASLGVAQVWVSEQHRRHGIAASLLDTARDNFLFGSSKRLSVDLLAFSQPTRYGKAFAACYVQTARQKEREREREGERSKEDGTFLIY